MGEFDTAEGPAGDVRRRAGGHQGDPAEGDLGYVPGFGKRRLLADIVEEASAKLGCDMEELPAVSRGIRKEVDASAGPEEDARFDSSGSHHGDAVPVVAGQYVRQIG